MSEMGLILLLFAVALIILTAEIFVPSHGLLSVAGLAFLIAAIVKTFALGHTQGTIAVFATLVALPAFVVTAIKIWPNTKIGRLIAPLNPDAKRHRRAGEEQDHLEAFVGSYGRTVTPLRPVGTCVFGDRRLPCVSDSGMIDADRPVRAVGVRGLNLEVMPADSGARRTTAASNDISQ